MKIKRFLVIGLGPFGGSLAQTLVSLGHTVVAIDINPTKVEKYSSILWYVYQADSTNEQVLNDLGIHNFHHVIVALGNEQQESITTTLLLQDLKAQNITVKSTNFDHSRILEKIGIHRIIQPESNVGINLAHQLVSKNGFNYGEASPEYSVSEVSVMRSMNGEAIVNLELRTKYDCNIIAIKRLDNQMIISPHAQEVIYTGDVLYIIFPITYFSR